LSGKINAGEALKVGLDKKINISNKEGIITFLDNNGLKIYGVYYAKENAQKEGWTMIF